MEFDVPITTPGGLTSFTSVIFNANEVLTIQFNFGMAILSVHIGADQVVNMGSVGTNMFTIPTSSTYNISINRPDGALVTIRCNVTTTTTSTTTSTPADEPEEEEEPTGPSADDFQRAANLIAGIIEVSGPFQSNFNWREAADLLLNQNGATLGPNHIRDYGTVVDNNSPLPRDRVFFNYDGFYNRANGQNGLDFYYELKKKRNPWPRFLAGRNHKTPGGQDWNGLTPQEEVLFQKLRAKLIESGELPADEADGDVAGAPLAYAPVADAPQPLYVSAYGNGSGQASTYQNLIRDDRYGVWFEGGVVTTVDNGTGGLSQTVGGGKLGFAARVAHKVAVNADIYVKGGSFKVPSVSQTGHFTEVGVTLGPVIKLPHGMFLAISGRVAHVDVDQTLSSVTGDFDATKWALNVLLGGHYVVGYYLLEPEASIVFRKFDGKNFVTSSGIAVTGADSDSVQGRVGMRVSRQVRLFDNMPVAPHVAVYLNWNNFNANTIGGISVDGFSADFHGGFDMPVGEAGTLSVSAQIGNVGSNAGATLGGMVKYDKRW